MSRSRQPVAGRTVLITGAARGIGAEAARRLAAAGARIALVGLEPERMAALADELPDAAWFEADVTDRAQLARAVDAAAARFGGLDVVIANAGVAGVGTVERMDPDAFERIIEVNLLGVWRTLRCALPHVIERRGYVLAIASLAAAVHSPLMAPYTASKAGVEALADAMRLELEGHGVAVGVAYFGFIETDMVRDAFDHPSTTVLRRGLGALSKPAPISAAGKAILRGVEQRARRVVAPRSILPLLHAPRAAAPLLEAIQRRGGAAEAIAAANAPDGLSHPAARPREL